MAENKTSFLMYCDMIHSFETLTDEEAGKLVKHLFRYVNDMNPVAPDRFTEKMFEPIKHKLKEALLKWEETKKKRAEAGSKGGQVTVANRNKTKQDEANQANASIIQANQAVTGTVTVDKSLLKEEITSAGTFETDTHIDQLEVVEPEYYDNERDFLTDFNKARKYYDNIETEIESLVSHEKYVFREIKKQFPIPAIRGALVGMFEQQGMFIYNRLRPKHFLENVEMYKECEKNGIKLFADKIKDPKTGML